MIVSFHDGPLRGEVHDLPDGITVWWAPAWNSTSPFGPSEGPPSPNFEVVEYEINLDELNGTYHGYTRQGPYQQLLAQRREQIRNAATTPGTLTAGDVERARDQLRSVRNYPPTVTLPIHREPEVTWRDVRRLISETRLMRALHDFRAAYPDDGEDIVWIFPLGTLKGLKELFGVPVKHTPYAESVYLAKEITDWRADGDPTQGEH